MVEEEGEVRLAEVKKAARARGVEQEGERAQHANVLSVQVNSKAFM